MQQKKPVLVRISESLQLPPQLRPTVPTVELIGRHNLVLTRHHGLLEYTAQCICADSAAGVVTVRGSDLVITQMNSRDLTVSGTIESVAFAEDGL